LKFTVDKLFPYGVLVFIIYWKATEKWHVQKVKKTGSIWGGVLHWQKGMEKVG